MTTMTARREWLMMICSGWLLYPSHLMGERTAATLPELRSKVPKRAEPTGNLIVIHPAQIVEEYRLRVGQHDYFLGVTSEHRVWHIEVRDPEFATPEGLHVGDAVSKALSLPGVFFHQLPGCFAYVFLPSRWAVGFWPVWKNESDEASEKYVFKALKSADEVPKSATVGFVFKNIYIH